MSKFFINRPIFAWVVAIFISLAGIVSITQLPVEQFPSVTPPTIVVKITYPGAISSDVDKYVLNLIANEMRGIEGLMYYHSTAESGSGSLTMTFKTGTDINFAQIEVQNRLAKIESKLPEAVKQYGIQVSKSNTGFLMMASFTTENPHFDMLELTDYVNSTIVPEIKSVDGVGNTILFSANKAVRIWLNPQKLHDLNLSAEKVVKEIKTQNIQITGGALGSAPNTINTTKTELVITGNLQTTQELENIILKTNEKGAIVRLKDVAKIELGKSHYNFNAMSNAKNSIMVAVQLSTVGNAITTVKGVRDKLNELKKFFPDGVNFTIPYDTSKFVAISIKKVINTLLEAILLVFIVILLFLQNIRYTLIPTLVVPVSLLGTFFVLYISGMSINMLSMFAMVLVIGIIVDDAIVVVENVERNMKAYKLQPKEATIKAMKEISGAVVGITAILISVFLPLYLFSGTTGNIYKQFSMVMAVSITFSGFLALSFTPALCVTLLKYNNEEENNYKKSNNIISKIFFIFNILFNKINDKYYSISAKLIKKIVRLFIIYIVIILSTVLIFQKIPKSFLPKEDQGLLFATFILNSNATQARTLNTLKFSDKIILSQQNVVDTVSTIQGYSGLGAGDHVGMSFISLKDWDQRKTKELQASEILKKLQGMLFIKLKPALAIIRQPPAIMGLGSADGFSFVLQDRNNLGHKELMKAKEFLLTKVRENNPIIKEANHIGMEDTSKLQIMINRDLAARYNVSMQSIANTLGVNLSSVYIGDIQLGNKELKQIFMQSNNNLLSNENDIKNLTVVNSLNIPVPLSTFVSYKYVSDAMQIKRYNGYPSIFLEGSAKAGYSSGDAMKEMEKIASKLPAGFGFEWTGVSLEEKKAGAQAIILYIFAIIAVFLCLATLYNSWSIPFAVILVAPLGIFGMSLGAYFNKIANGIYFQIALITVIGLSAKNAILIVEFAKELQDSGKSVMESALEAAKLRFRPIIMTSLAFILGVIPLCLSKGASAASQKEIGVSVFWGMLIGTFLSVFLVPCFYIAIRSIFKGNSTKLSEGKNYETK